MIARSFLSKVLNLSKSSRLVLVATLIFGNASFVSADPVKDFSRFSPSSVSQKPTNGKSLEVANNLKQQVFPKLQRFGRTPSWPL